MIRAMFTAATGMIGQQLNVDTIANNLANVNTTGFKKSRVNFQDLIYETMKPAGTQTANGNLIPEGIQIGHGTRPASVAKLFTPGNMISTGNPLDLAIEGDGFFQVKLPDGRTAYTRDGSFKMDANGNVTTADGYPLEPALTIDPNYIQIVVGSDGVVSALVAGQNAAQQQGNIQLVRFVNPAGLDARLGKNLLLESDASGSPLTAQPGQDGVGTISQGFLENSNVQVVEEIINLITAQRAYEANSRVITTSDDMLQTVNQMKR